MEREIKIARNQTQIINIRGEGQVNIIIVNEALVARRKRAVIKGNFRGYISEKLKGLRLVGGLVIEVSLFIVL
jgi:hypothetical protein